MQINLEFDVRMREEVKSQDFGINIFISFQNMQGLLVLISTTCVSMVKHVLKHPNQDSITWYLEHY